MRRSLVTIGVIVVLASLAYAVLSGRATIDDDGATLDQRLLLLVFVDVTSSLDADEIRSVGDYASEIVSAVPDGSRIVVLPILRDVERARSLKDVTLRVPATSRDMADLQAQRRQLAVDIRKDIATVVPEVNRDPSQHRSCVSNAFRRAAEIIGGADQSMPAEIVLISDMIEECDNSLEGRAVNLAREHIPEDIQRAKSITSPLLNLRQARVTGLIPAARAYAESYGVRKRPPVHELREYWRALLDRCGDDPSKFAVGADVPPRFRTPAGGH